MIENDMIDNKSKNNNYWIIGKHAVEAALNNPNRLTYRLCVTQDSIHKIKFTKKKLKPEIMSRLEISKLTNSNIHQGVALLTKPLEKINLKTFLKNRKNTFKTFIILDQITDSQNIGAIIRSAAAFSVTGIIMLDKNSPTENSTLSKAAVGTLEKVPLFKVSNIVQTINLLKEYDFWTVGLDTQAKQTLTEISKNSKIFSGNISLVMGSESKGIRKLIKDNCDITAKIEIKNTVESLNVSVALAISLYEINRS